MRQAVELQAAELETNAEAARYREAEENLAGAVARAEQHADKKLDALVNGGSQSFREVFTRARNLLGRKWPLFSAAAMPPTRQDGRISAKNPPRQ